MLLGDRRSRLVFLFGEKLSTLNLALDELQTRVKGEPDSDTLEAARPHNVFVHSIGWPGFARVTHFADEIVAPISTDADRFPTALTADIDPQRCIWIPVPPGREQAFQPLHMFLPHLTSRGPYRQQDDTDAAQHHQQDRTETVI